MLTVALIPALLTQFLVVFGEGQSARAVFWVLVALTAGVLLGFWVYEVRSLPGDSVTLLHSLDAGEQQKIVGAVSVVAHVGEGPPKAVQNLIDRLPNLRTVYAVVCEGDDGQAEALQSWVDGCGAGVSVVPLRCRPSRHRPDELIIDRLAEELAALRDAGVVVDVTADNKLMTIALASAASRAGLPTTFLAAVDPARQQRTAELVVIQDPSGMFTERATLPS